MFNKLINKQLHCLIAETILCFFSLRAQDLFRQAMKSQNIILEVVASYGREQYEKSVIAPLYSPNKADHISKGKFPPAAHPKPMMKDPDFSEANNLETGTHASSKSPNFSRINRKPPSPSLSPLMGFGSKKNAKKIRIDLKKGNGYELLILSKYDFFFLHMVDVDVYI